MHLASTELNMFHMPSNQVKKQISHTHKVKGRKKGAEVVLIFLKKNVVQDNSGCECWLLAVPQSAAEEKQNEEGLSG